MPIAPRLPTLLLLCLAPLAAGAQQQPIVDPSFNGGLHFTDRFAGSTAHHFLARKIVRLRNGDTIVAGLVSWGSQTGPGGKMNLGLVRYNARGERVAWGSGPDGSFTHFGRQYLIYPKTSSLITQVRDLAVFGNTVYVLVDRDALSGCSSNCLRSVSVLAFRLDDGAFVEIETAFGSAFDEYGAGLVPLPGGFGASKLLVVGTRVLGDGRRTPIFRRFVLASGDGAMSADETFAPSGFKQLDLSPAFCGGSCDAPVEHVAAHGGDVIPVTIYIGGNLYTTQGVEQLLLKVDSSATLQADFGSGGAGRYFIESPQSPGYYQAPMAALAVEPGDFFVPGSDRIYFACQGPWSTGSRNFIAKVRGDGTRELNFGFVNGTSTAPTAVHNLRALAVHGDSLVTVGQDKFFSSDPGDARIGVIDKNAASSGSIGTPVRTLPAVRAGGTRIGESLFHDVAISPRGRVMLAGEIREDDAAGTYMFGTIAACLTDAACNDLFRDGFEH